MKKSWSLLVVLFVVLAVGMSACQSNNKSFVYQSYSGIEPNMSLPQAKDYCGTITSNAKRSAKLAQKLTEAQNKTYWSDGYNIYQQNSSGGFWGGFSKSLSKSMKGNFSLLG